MTANNPPALIFNSGVAYTIDGDTHPTPNNIRGLVAVMPFIKPLASAGAGMENSLYGFVPEMSYTMNVLTQASLSSPLHTGLRVKS